MSVVLAVPAAIVDLQQQGLLERAFHDGLFPQLLFRAEAMFEEWPLNTGNQVFMTRAGLLPTISAPLVPGNDPAPQAVAFEQWAAELNQFAGTVDIDMPTSATANASLFLRDIHQLGLQGGRSVNSFARNALFKSYLSGQTNATAAIGAGDTSVQVASLNGFRFVLNTNVRSQPQPVSPATPLPIKIGPTGPTQVNANVVGYIPNNPTDIDGPGTLLLAAAVGSAFVATRTPVKSIYAPKIIRPSGGDSVDSVSSTDTFVLQAAINSVAQLRKANVRPHDDGFYHAHISPDANAQVFNDQVFQRLNTALPEHVIYKEGFIGTIAGVMFFMNNETPGLLNSGPLTATGTKALYAQDIGAEVENENGIQINRTIITGKGSIYERGLDEKAYSTEAGTTGKIGEFQVVNNGIEIATQRIRLVLRAPLDRLQQKMSATWSISTSFPIPSDATSPSGPELYKRAVIIESAL